MAAVSSSSLSSLLNSLSSLHLSASSPPPTFLAVPSSPAAGTSQSLKHKQHISPIVVDKQAECSLPDDLIGVLCPALANSNTMFFKSAYNIQVIVGEHEPEEKLIGRFRREVFRARIIQECKRRRYFESNQEKRKRKTRDAARRNSKRRPMVKPPLRDQQEVTKEVKDEEDNWDLTDVKVPYCGPL